jgi:hypothetical protein
MQRSSSIVLVHLPFPWHPLCPLLLTARTRMPSRLRLPRTDHSSDLKAANAQDLASLTAADVLPLHSRFHVHYGSLLDVPADALVNAANEGLEGGGGVDFIIHARAGSELAAACRSLPRRAVCYRRRSAHPWLQTAVTQVRATHCRTLLRRAGETSTQFAATMLRELHDAGVGEAAAKCRLSMHQYRILWISYAASRTSGDHYNQCLATKRCIWHADNGGRFQRPRATNMEKNHRRLG